LAGADFVAVGEGGILDAGAVEEGAIAAVAVAEHGPFGAALDGEVDAGHERVMGQGEIGASGGATEGDGLTGADGHLFAGHRPGLHFENYGHFVSALSTLAASIFTID
jgi:hypothetical protein